MTLSAVGCSYNSTCAHMCTILGNDQLRKNLMRRTASQEVALPVVYSWGAVLLWIACSQMHVLQSAEVGHLINHAAVGTILGPRERQRRMGKQNNNPILKW